MSRNGTLVNTAELYQSALSNLLTQAGNQGHSPAAISNIRLTRRFNNVVGEHVHALATVKVHIFAEANTTTPARDVRAVV